MRNKHAFWLLPLLTGLSACSEGDQVPSASVVYPAMDTAAYTLFSMACSQCHVPPKPGMHAANEWPMVMARMQKHRSQRGLPLLSADERDMIVSYLQEYAQVEKE